MIVFVWTSPQVFYRHAISAFIGVGDGMQRLVQISNEMDDVSQRLRLLCRIGILVFQNGQLLADRFRNASFFSAKRLERSALRSSRYIDVMPGAVLPLSPHVVRPRGRVRH